MGYVFGARPFGYDGCVMHLRWKSTRDGVTDEPYSDS